MKSISFSLLWFGILLAYASGTVVRTPAMSAATACANGLKVYSQAHSGTLPKDLVVIFDEHPDRLPIFEGMIGEKIERRFRLLQTGEVSNDRGESVIVVTRDQVYEDFRSGNGRYVVWFKDGSYRVSWETEDAIQDIFRKASQQLETLGTWPQQPTAGLPHMKPAEAPKAESNRLAQSNNAGSTTPVVPFPKTSASPPMAPSSENTPAGGGTGPIWIVWLFVAVIGSICAWLWIRKSLR